MESLVSASAQLCEVPCTLFLLSILELLSMLECPKYLAYISLGSPASVPLVLRTYQEKLRIARIALATLKRSSPRDRARVGG